MVRKDNGGLEILFEAAVFLLDDSQHRRAHPEFVPGDNPRFVSKLLLSPGLLSIVGNRLPFIWLTPQSPRIIQSSHFC